MENHKIILELDPATKRITLNANFDDDIVFYGMLGKAKVLYEEYRYKAAMKVQPVSVLPAELSH